MSQNKLKQSRKKNATEESSQNSSQSENSFLQNSSNSEDCSDHDHEILKPLDVFKLMEEEISKVHEVVDVSLSR
jgi:hypothetical protein